MRIVRPLVSAPLVPALLVVFQLDLLLFEVLELALHVVDELPVLGEPVLYFIQLLFVNDNVIHDNGLDVAIVLLHYIFIFEFFFDLVHALHVGVHDLAALGALAVGVQILPLEVVELQIEV